MTDDIAPLEPADSSIRHAHPEQLPRRISLLVAMTPDRVMGKDNRVPWRLPAELKIFKDVSMGHHIVMGRLTYESINRLLPGRTTVIVTRNPGYRVEGAIVAHSLEEALAACGDDPEIIVIGGAVLFESALLIANRIYLTYVHAKIDGDTFMPEFDMSEWREVASTHYAADEKNPYDFTFTVLDRVKS